MAESGLKDAMDVLQAWVDQYNARAGASIALASGGEAGGAQLRLKYSPAEGPIGRAIILLAVPMVLEMLMESLFAVADVFWAGHLGPNAVATISLTESVLTLVYTAAMGLSFGVTAMVARRIGEKKPHEAAEA